MRSCGSAPVATPCVVNEKFQAPDRLVTTAICPRHMSRNLVQISNAVVSKWVLQGERGMARVENSNELDQAQAYNLAMLSGHNHAPSASQYT